jgi:hypothetical protein
MTFGAAVIQICPGVDIDCDIAAIVRLVGDVSGGVAA